MNAVELKLRLTPAAFALAIINALGAAFADLQGFLLETEQEAAGREFFALFCSLMAFWIGLYLFTLVAGACDRYRRREKVQLPTALIVGGLTALFLFIPIWFLHLSARGDVWSETGTFLSLIFEIGSVVLVVGPSRQRAIGDRAAVFALWAMSLLTGFNAVGITEWLTGYSFDNSATGLYCLMIFHAANACYLFYMAFDRYAERRRRPHAPMRAERREGNIGSPLR